MKRIFISLVLCVVALASFAQKNDKNIIYVEIPKNFRIDDKIVVENTSPYMIQQIVIAIPTEEGFEPLGSLSNIEPNDDKSIDVNDRKLMKSLKGETLAIKVKGLKYLMTDIDDATEDIKRNDDSVAIYGFDVSISAHKNDLVIKVFYKNEQGQSIMDF